MSQWRRGWSLLGVFLILQMLLSPVLPGAPKRERRSERTVGLRHGDVQFYYGACSKVKKAALKGEILSESSARCGDLTPLHFAILADLEKVPELLQNGAAVNATAGNGVTPLHLAVYIGQYEIAMSLLDAGADALATTDRGGTALHMLYLAGKSSGSSTVSRMETAQALACWNRYQRG